jgi:hypothetical protein
LKLVGNKLKLFDYAGVKNVILKKSCPEKQEKPEKDNQK